MKYEDYEGLGLHPFLEYYHKWYKIPERAYHNIEHAREVARLCYAQSESPELVLAAIYHYAVYIPKSKSNEENSALALEYDAACIARSGKKVDQEVVWKACGLISQTDVSTHLTSHLIADHDAAILLDSDLGSLSLPYESFLERQASILKENNLSRFNLDNWKKTSAFLNQFLKCRRYIYHTDFAREHWETQARENIIRLQTVSAQDIGA